MKTEAMQVAREWLEECVRVATRNGVPEEADLEAAVLAHIDAEPARQAAAVAAAMESVDALRVDQRDYWMKAHADAVAERDALRAQVEAARAWATRNTEVLDVVEPATDPWTAGYDDAITDLLAAMDGAKP